jgi:chromosome segregation ATPase
MKIKTITFGRTFNTGNYESSRYDMSADVDALDNPDEGFSQLQQLIEQIHKSPILAEKLAKLEDQQADARLEVRNLKKEIIALEGEIESLKREKSKLRESLTMPVENSDSSEDSNSNEAEAGGDDDDIPFDSAKF